MPQRREQRRGRKPSKRGSILAPSARWLNHLRLAHPPPLAGAGGVGGLASFSSLARRPRTSLTICAARSPPLILHHKGEETLTSPSASAQMQHALAPKPSDRVHPFG